MLERYYAYGCQGPLGLARDPKGPNWWHLEVVKMTPTSKDHMPKTPLAHEIHSFGDSKLKNDMRIDKM